MTYIDKEITNAYEAQDALSAGHKVYYGPARVTRLEIEEQYESGAPRERIYRCGGSLGIGLEDGSFTWVPFDPGLSLFRVDSTTDTQEIESERKALAAKIKAQENAQYRRALTAIREMAPNKRRALRQAARQGVAAGFATSFVSELIWRAAASTIKRGDALFFE